MLNRRHVVLLTLALSTVACNRHARQTNTSDQTALKETDNRATRSAVRSIADARCEREQRCGNIGVDAKYEDERACLDRVRSDWADELSARECPAGVRRSELDECLEDIRGEECGSPLDSLQRMFSCGTAEICSDARG